MGFHFPQMHVENNIQIFKTETKRYKESNNKKLDRKYWVKLLIIEILELECGLYCSLFYAVEPLRGKQMVDPRWQKAVVHYGVKGGFRCN